MGDDILLEQARDCKAFELGVTNQDRLMLGFFFCWGWMWEQRPG
jgi:hypothetical protein